MKEFLKILRRFVPPYKKYLFLNIFFNILAAFLTLFSFALIIPILEMLFMGDKGVVYHYMDWTSGSFKDVAINNFYYSAYYCKIHLGPSVTLMLLASSTNDADGISRLQQAKFIVEKLFDRMTNDKVGLVVFAGDAYVQMPITNDFSSAKMFLNSLSTNMVSNQGTAIGAAIETSMGLFSNNPKCQKSIVLITDAENHEDDAIAAAKAAKDKGVEIDVVGVGSSSPMPIPMGGGTYMSFNNQLVRTAFNEQSAQEIAKVGTGVYVSGNNTSAVDILDDQLKKAKKTNMDKKVFSPADEQFPVFAWIALILLVTDILVSEKKISWLTKTNFFGK